MQKTVKECTFAVVILYDKMNDGTGYLGAKHGYIRFWGHLEEDSLVLWLYLFYLCAYPKSLRWLHALCSIYALAPWT